MNEQDYKKNEATEQDYNRLCLDLLRIISNVVCDASD